MQPTTSKKAPPQRSSAWIPLIVLTVVIAAALLWFLRPYSKQAQAPASRADRGQTSYHNRALLRPKAGAADAAETPAVQGNVYDSSGGLLAGATLVATTFDSAGNMPSPVGSTKSDAQGHFTIPLPRGTYEINATLPGYGPSMALAQSGETASLVLYKSGVIQGHVLDERGQPVQKFTIDVLYSSPADSPAAAPAWSKTFESRDGSYRADQIPTGMVVVRAVADDRAPGLSKPVAVRPGDTRDVDLTLTNGCTLSGVVVDKRGNPLPRVLVNAEERMASGSAMDPALQTASQTQSGDDGTFTLEHVPQGTLLVRGYDGDYAVTTATADVKDCDKLAPVRLVMSVGGAVTGTARSADGKPVMGARVTITDRSVGFVNTTTDRTGRFRFDAIPEGRQRIELEYQGQDVVRYVLVKDGETATQDMTLFATGTGEVRGKLMAGDKPIAGMRLMVVSNHGAEEGLAMYFPVTGADGSYSVRALPEGAYLVSALSARAGGTVQLKADQVATVNLDVAPIVPRTVAKREAPTPSP